MILCGNFNLNMENNLVLFRAVHRYIYMLLSVLKPVDSLFDVFLETYFLY